MYVLLFSTWSHTSAQSLVKLELLPLAFPQLAVLVATLQFFALQFRQ